MDFVENIIDIYKLAKVVISRAGAGVVSELLALNKKSIFIPLKIAQKNEQYHNAMEAYKKLGSVVILEDELYNTNIIDEIKELANSNQNQKRLQSCSAVEIILQNLN